MLRRPARTVASQGISRPGLCSRRLPVIEVRAAIRRAESRSCPMDWTLHPATAIHQPDQVLPDGSSRQVWGAGNVQAVIPSLLGAIVATHDGGVWTITKNGSAMPASDGASTPLIAVTSLVPGPSGPDHFYAVGANRVLGPGVSSGRRRSPRLPSAHRSPPGGGSRVARPWSTSAVCSSVTSLIGSSRPKGDVALVT